jgi:hypothetical protein
VRRRRFLTLIFRDGRSALAFALAAERVSVIAFDCGRRRILSEQRVPAGLIQFVGSPHRSIRLGVYAVNGEQVAMLFDELRQFGYAINLRAPHYSEWGEAQDEIVPLGIEGHAIEGEAAPADEVDAGTA